MPVIKIGLSGESDLSTQTSSAYDAIATQTSPQKHPHTNILSSVAQKMKIWVSPPGRAFVLVEVVAKTDGNTGCTVDYGSIAI